MWNRFPTKALLIAAVLAAPGIPFASASEGPNQAAPCPTPQPKGSEAAPCATPGAPEPGNITLCFDHRAQNWVGQLPPGTEMAAGFPGIPTVFLHQGEKLNVQIIDTDPLLYAVASVTVTEEDSQLLKQLQDLAALLSKTVQGTLKGQPAPTNKYSPTLDDAVLVCMMNLQSELKRVQQQLDLVAAAKHDALSLLQRAEFGRPDKVDQDIWAGSKLKPAERIAAVTDSFSALRVARQNFAALDYRCILTQLRELVVAGDFGGRGDRDFDDITKVKAKAESWSQLALLKPVGCGSDPLATAQVKNTEKALDKLAAAFVRLADALTSGADIADAKKAAIEECKKIHSGDEGRLADLGENFQPILEAADDLLAKSDEARKAVANLVAFDLRRAAVEKGWKIVVPTPATGAQWSKVQEYTIDLRADSPYAGDLARNPEFQDMKIKYDVRWVGESVLGVAVGVTYTPLRDHTWAALPSPNDPSKKSPQPKTTDTRAGQLALFLNWRAVQTFWPTTRTWAAKPGIELGASLNSDKPGAYLGVSLEVLKALRLAYGRTWQQVTVLDGQVASVTVVESDTDIRTRQAFKPSWYASLTFALDSLSLFKKD
jgi:hypothetical protein